MKYEIRWSNGFWKLFDPNRYCSIACFESKATAEEALKKVKS